MEFIKAIDWSNVVVNTLAAVIVLGILIFIHEFGHYIVAKLIKVKVEVFSLGFGPRLLGFKRGETDYRLSLIPVGGYVKILGEMLASESTGDPRELSSRSRGERLLVFLMGPLTNILFAYFLLTAAYVIGVKVPAYLDDPPVIGFVHPESPAAEADMRSGDLILRSEEREFDNWRDLSLFIMTSPGKEIELQILRNGRTVNVPVKVGVESKRRTGIFGAFPKEPLVIGRLEKGWPAEHAGLKEGDVIVGINGRDCDSREEAMGMIGESAGVELLVKIKRGEEIFEKKMIPRDDNGRGRLGFIRKERSVIKKYPLREAAGESFRECLNLTAETYRIVLKLLRRDLSLRSASGPLEIAVISGSAAREGMPVFIALMAWISLNLGIINLLPIPALDGGHIFITLVETVMRRDLSPRLKEVAIQIGFLFLFALMGIVILFDFLKFI